MSAANAIAPIQSTAGAIPVRNDKGEVSMQKVKVHRYISGKRPDYAPDSDSDIESGDEDFLERQRLKRLLRAKRLHEEESMIPVVEEEAPEEIYDRRLNRLKRTVEKHASDDEEDFIEKAKRYRQVHEPEIMEASSDEDVAEQPRDPTSRLVTLPGDVESEDEEEVINDEERERRRAAIRQKLLSSRHNEEMEIMDKEEEIKFEESANEASEYEEYSDSEEEDTGPRLKPVFVRRRERLTVMEREKAAEQERVMEIEARRAAEERKRYTLKLVEEEIRKDAVQMKKASDEVGFLNDVCTDDENDELEYEAWKLREVKRLKRDKDEKDTSERERLELDRLRNMTEEQRRLELRQNPKLVTNKAHKGKYKFLQKYYHRGAFYLDQEDEVFKRDFSSATLEDHFDKSVLPKVMQVKNFGRSGRTKYTHLVDQDTTQFDSPWAQDMTSNKTVLKSSTSKDTLMNRM